VEANFSKMLLETLFLRMFSCPRTDASIFIDVPAGYMAEAKV